MGILRRNGTGRLVTLAVILAVATVVTPGPAQATPAAASVVPSGFSDKTVLSGLSQPTAVAFAPDGHVFVAEKAGLVKVYDSLSDTTATTFADLRTNVYDYHDRGLLGLAVDPQWPRRPYVYVGYTYDAVPGGTAPRWNDACPDATNGCLATARVSKLVSNASVTSSTEQPLITGWCQQFLSHSIGAVAFGRDGGLYVSGGEGASYTFADYGQAGNPCGDPPSPAGTNLSPPSADGGALRAQSPRRDSNRPRVLGGAILRIDPDTGAGLAGNPFASSTDPNARRIIAYGMRNPFRFTMRPGSDQLWVGDVGWQTFEEVNRVADINDGLAENFGWPCFEGTGHQGGYDAANLTRCESLYTSPGTYTGPTLTYAHSAKVTGSDACPTGQSAVSGVAFEEGSNYPSTYRGALFFADYARQCIWAMPAGSNGEPNPAAVTPFANTVGSVVQLTTGPGGDIFYVDIAGGAVHRIVYNGANHPPSATVSASPLTGPAPLSVHFDGSGSTDLDTADTLSYAWDLDGDGAFDDSTAVSPTFTYTANGTYVAALRVTDNHGADDTQSVTIVVGPPNSPPVPVIDTPTSSLTWAVGDTISFSGHATDTEDGTLAASRLSWSMEIHHCPDACHTHPGQDFVGVASGSFPGPDHDYPMYLTLSLTALDSAGAKATTSVRLDPKTVDLTAASAPTGLNLALDSDLGAAPLTHTVIVGSANSVSAPGPQSLNGQVYAFDTWSDGRAQTHLVTAPASSTTVTANYRQVVAGCSATPDFFHTIPGPVGPPAATVLPDGRSVFGALGSDGITYLSAQNVTPEPPVAGPLECYGALSTDNPAVAAGSSSVSLFTRSPNSRIYQRTLTSASAGSWSAIPIGGGSNDGPAATVASSSAGEVVHLAIRGQNGALYHASRRGTTWTSWENLGGGILGPPAIAPRPGGGAIIVARGTNNGIYMRSGDTGHWGGWVRLSGATASSPTIAAGFQPGRVDMFVVGTSGGLYETTYLNGAWGTFVRRGDNVPATARLAAATPPGRVIVDVTAGGTTTYRHYRAGMPIWPEGPVSYTCPLCVPPRSTTGSVR